MPSHLFADRPAPQPPERGTLDALISQTRRLRGDVDAVRRDAVVDEDDPQGRWQRALCDLAVHQLDDLGAQLGQLKEGVPDGPAQPAELYGDMDADDGAAAADPPPTGSLLSRVGSAEWNLLTDEVSWSDELYVIFGRSPEAGPMTLDELPSMVFAEDQALLTAMVTGCLIDGKPIDGEFRIVRTDGRVRTLHMMGEPVLDVDGCTASMWAVLRDVSELRRSERAVRESRDSLQRAQHIERTEHRMAVELQEAVLPPWRGSSGFPHGGPAGLDLAGQYLPSGSRATIGGDWYDALELPDGEALLTVGDLTGRGVSATSTMAMLLGALRGMAVAGIRPGALMGYLNQVLDSSSQPALGSAVCCRYDPRTRTLTWAQAGHPAPLLFRGGTGHALTRPEGVLLGATAGTAYEQAEVRLLPGDLLVLHTDGLTRDSGGRNRLLELAPRFAGARDAQECVRSVVEEFGRSPREGDACVMVARVGGPS
ncbi:phosphatase [Streptomyces sp. WAC05374]|uniref:PP2C family protein-serine/threonine phosphatase n=1 Tax=Streptomyces sp. WAC05374 TaxID=2487420 RepID=UPI000F88F6CD|nr:SpoIIE family protein phosphatase [Streptomyces sp. WAC05374]RST10887.1 phosphatase [Streptomyces sp. WAC05374]TDF50327.1 phosphatase [Streptomyces sp. WAC05374]TDF58051.1 phosphatase [Streptomyces sp. WAC05374]TDF60579.1 phosphatase [Streptomyces sp. WAC05374]